MKIIVIKDYLQDIFKLVVSELWAMIGLVLYSLSFQRYLQASSQWTMSNDWPNIVLLMFICCLSFIVIVCSPFWVESCLYMYSAPVIKRGVFVAMWSWSYGSWIYNYLCKQFLSPNTIVSSTPIHGEVYSIQHYVLKFVSDLWQVESFLQVLRFPPPIKLTTTI